MDAPTAANSSFSKELPGLQIAVDSTSLGEFKTCPRRYYYSIICGHQSREASPHLVFGIALHTARERYDHYRFDGADHEEALRKVLWLALCESWSPSLKRSAMPEHRTKTRRSLIQTIVWYLDEIAQHDTLVTLKLANGEPAVELSFQFDSGLRYEASTGEAIHLCGHLDRIAALNDDPYIVDLKTTEHTLDASFVTKFSPDNQFSLYTIAGRVAFQFETRGLIVDGIQVGVGFSRFNRSPIPRSAGQNEEWLRDTGYYLQQMERCALDAYWPQNDKACGLYGGCQFRGICSKHPESRQGWLDSGFTKRVWDPLKKRGDI